MSYQLLEQLGRRVRWGMIGGGNDSLIGEVHRLAARLDNRYDLVAGTFSIDSEVSRRTAAQALVAPERCYDDWRDMIRREKDRADGVEVVTIATPPHLHAEVAIACLEARFAVLCEKPMCNTMEEVAALERAVRATDGLFAVTHCYLGYPLVREARQLVANGVIGEVRQVQCDFPSGPFLTEEPDRNKRHWRFRPEMMGKEAILGELGAHCFSMARFVSGKDPVAVSAHMSTLTEGRETYDDVHLITRYDNGSLGRMWMSFCAAGNEHGLSFQIFGTQGALKWSQEAPEELWLFHADKPAERIRPGFPERLSEEGFAACRLREGHPEGYMLAFANLYRDFADIMIARNLGHDMPDRPVHVSDIYDGAAAMGLYHAAARSQAEGGQWITIAEDSRQ